MLPPIKPETRQRSARLLLIILIATVLIDATRSQSGTEPLIPHLDKLLHFLVYGTIAWLCAYVIPKPTQLISWPRLAGIFLFTTCLGLLVEWIQSHTPGRDASIHDLYANMAGALTFLLYWYPKALLQR